MVRKIVDKIPEKQMEKDLDRYKGQAIDLGATDAKVITADHVIIDERVRAKCLYHMYLLRNYRPLPSSQPRPG